MFGDARHLAGHGVPTAAPVFRDRALHRSPDSSQEFGVVVRWKDPAVGQPAHGPSSTGFIPGSCPVHGTAAVLRFPVPQVSFFSQAMFLGADSQSPAGPEHASRSSKGRGAAFCECCWRHKMKNVERDGGGAMTSHALSIYSFSDPGELYPVASRFLASSSC